MKRGGVRALGAALFAAVLLGASARVEAAPPTRLSRTSLEETDQKCAAVSSFGVTYTFGDKEIAIDAESAMTWFVTSASLERMKKEVKGEGKEKSGVFIIDGKETSLPQTISIENGFATDKNGNLIISESAMYETMKRMFDQYNSKVEDGATVFHATSGRTVFFGGEPEQIAKVNLESEFQKLKAAFLNKETGVQREIYTQTVDAAEVKTIGDSYIEVDMADQMLYMYLNGELIVETPVVTGNMAWGMGTPQGIFPLINRIRGATLVGANYRTYVNYWMAFTYNGHGIHDSTWRTSGYGGDIYLNDGSHGCVNTPIDKVAIIFEYAYPGLPVVTFY